jgi:hypothetical protein
VGYSPTPECRFRWSRLIVDLTPTRGAVIRDLEPKEVLGDRPVELMTTIGARLKFQTSLKVLQAEPKLEYATSRTIYYPEIVAVGDGTPKAYWDFLALGTDYLHVTASCASS